MTFVICFIFNTLRYNKVPSYKFKSHGYLPKINNQSLIIKAGIAPRLPEFEKYTS